MKRFFAEAGFSMRFRRQLAVLCLILAADLCLAAGLLCMVHERNSWNGKVGSTWNGKAGSIWNGKAENVWNGKTGSTWKGKSGGVARAASAGEAIPEPKVAALTFDDGPNQKYTEILLDGLKTRGVKASFFLIGECIEGNESIVARMEEEGHLIGVHCMFHTDLTKEETSAALKQLEDTGAMIEAITGKKPEYVRPPFGSWNEILGETISMEPVFWNVDSVDWKLQNTSKIVKKVMKDTKNGDIILMHDEFSTSVEAALQIIDNMLANGYTFVTVDELTID